MAKRNPQQEQADQREARKKIIERASQRQAEFHARQEHESLQAQAKMTAMPIHHEHAAVIIVGVVRSTTHRRAGGRKPPDPPCVGNNVNLNEAISIHIHCA